MKVWQSLRSVVVNMRDGELRGCGFDFTKVDILSLHFLILYFPGLCVSLSIFVLSMFFRARYFNWTGKNVKEDKPP